MNYKLLPDGMLVRLMKSSDEHAFKEIYSRYWQPLYVAALRKIRSGESAEELTQGLFLSLWQNRGTADIGHLEAYLHTAIKYRIINYVAASLSHEKHLQRLRDTAPSSVNDTADALLCSELSEAISRAVGQLPEKTREVFRLSRFENKSTREIASTMNLSEKSVEYHITQSLKYLRVHLKEYVLLALVMGLL